MSDHLRTLVLSATYEPIGIYSWQRAIVKQVVGRAEPLHFHDHVVHRTRMGVETRAPSVIKLRPGEKMRSVRSFVNPKYSKQNIFIRDKYTCQYCGFTGGKNKRHVNLDHVIPESRGGRACWENIVVSCYRCNSRKADRTPHEAGMSLLREPFKPKTLPLQFVLSDMGTFPTEWEQYVGTYSSG